MNLKKITPLAIQIVNKYPFTECFSYPLLHVSIHELLLRYSQIYNEIYVYKYTFDLLLSMLKTLLQTINIAHALIASLFDNKLVYIIPNQPVYYSVVL